MGHDTRGTEISVLHFIFFSLQTVRLIDQCCQHVTRALLLLARSARRFRIAHIVRTVIRTRLRIVNRSNDSGCSGNADRAWIDTSLALQIQIELLQVSQENGTINGHFSTSNRNQLTQDRLESRQSDLRRATVIAGRGGATLAAATVLRRAVARLTAVLASQTARVALRRVEVGVASTTTPALDQVTDGIDEAWTLADEAVVNLVVPDRRVNTSRVDGDQACQPPAHVEMLSDDQVTDRDARGAEAVDLQAVRRA